MVATLRTLVTPATPSHRARSEAVRARFARAVRRQIAVNRLAGTGAPGAGSLLEQARKKGEQRHTATVMAARNLCDTDSEALVLAFARVEEERHEAVAARKLHQVVERVERLRLAAEVHTAKTKAAAQEAQLTVAKREAEAARRVVADLRDQAFQAQWRVREAEIRTEVVFRKMMDAQTTSHKAEMDALRHEVRTLRSLTETMIAGRKRAQDDVAACEAARAAARAREV